MKIEQSFEVSRSPAEVWELFQDIPSVASCMPGAELTEDNGDGSYAGRVNIKLGPFGASFEGKAQVEPDPTTRTAHVEGSGLDRRGGSRSKLKMNYKVSEAPSGSRVDILADIQLSGPIAQFGRTAVVTETANVLIGEFARNFEKKLQESGGDLSGANTSSGSMNASATSARTPQKNQISVFKILGLLISSFFSWRRRA